ncbi:MAG: prephenate dehydratase [Gammaproteobacteria bacterium]|nr:MAG: prephenate dehydratase [Gammaproteobacteria bacterium]
MSQDSLLKVRQEIDKIDKNILHLLNQRAKIAQIVADIKTKTKNNNFYRPEREAMVLDKISKLNAGPLSDESVRILFREIMSVCLALEQPMQIGFLGPVGTFTHAAAIKHFGHAGITHAYNSINAVFAAVAVDNINYGVVPIENSTEGVVTHTLDSFVESQVQIISEVTVRVEHNFATAKNNKQQQKITKIYSHQQSFAQCRAWLEEFYPNIEKFTVSSNSIAAKKASAEPNTAAITSKTAADIYNLQIMNSNIEDNSNNTTRFLIIGKQKVAPSNNDKTSILLATKHEAGALYKLLQPLHANNVDMTRIESRPLKSSLWQYLFFIDIKGHQEDKNVKTALDILKTQSTMFKIIGSYPVSVL